MRMLVRPDQKVVRFRSGNHHYPVMKEQPVGKAQNLVLGADGATINPEKWRGICPSSSG